jgi:predicted enzyme related to lactoylglutathione lyase
MTKSNAIGWFDMYVDDMERAVEFYQAVLEQKLSKMGDPTGDSEMMSFPMTDKSMSQYGALGALVKMDGMKPSVGGTMIYFNSEDCAIEESRVAAAGGKVIRSKFSIGEFGWVVLCEDTEGNMFGLNSMK